MRLGRRWGQELKRKFTAMEGVVTDTQLNRHRSIVVDDDAGAASRG